MELDGIGGSSPDDLPVALKLTAAKLLVSLFEDSSTVRDMFRDDETYKKELWTELRDVRVKIKRLELPSSPPYPGLPNQWET